MVKSDGMGVLGRTLMPEESFTYSGRNDGSGVTVTFVKGQASSATCPGKSGMTGIRRFLCTSSKWCHQSVSAQTNIRTATTTRPDEALTSLPSLPATSGTSSACTGNHPGRHGSRCDDRGDRNSRVCSGDKKKINFFRLSCVRKAILVSAPISSF